MTGQMLSTKTTKLLCEYAQIYPRAIQLAAHGKSGLNVLKWTRQHWYNVSELTLQMDASVPDIERFIQEPSSVAPSSELQKLHIACSIAVIDGSPSFQAWLKRFILAHADRLKVLSLHMGTVPFVPPLPQLKNLVLYTRRNLPPEAFHCISQLPSLTSLCLGCGGLDQKSDLYKVDLALCAQLREVCFKTTLPDSIRLPAACQLAVRCTARQAMLYPKILREHCSLLDLHVEWLAWRKDFQTFLGATGLPPFLLLRSLTLHAESFGKRANYFVVSGSHLPNLTELRIECLTLWLRIEASARLKMLSLSVESRMYISVMEYSALCSRLERMRCYSTEKLPWRTSLDWEGP